MLVDKPLYIDDLSTNKNDINKITLLIKNIFELHQSNTKGSITISINGQWGSGKTSYLNAIQSYFDDFVQVPVLYFEAWKYKNDENILLTLISKIKDLEGVSSQQKLAITEFIKPFAVSSLLVLDKYLDSKGMAGVKDIQEMFSLVEKGTSFLHSQSEKNQNKLNNVIRDISENYTPSEQSNSIWNKIDDKNLPSKDNFQKTFILIIDDLDRLLPKDAFSIIESLRFYFDIDNVIIIMGINDQVLNQHIKSFYINDNISSEKFLEKIFQFNYELSSSSLNELHLKCFTKEEESIISNISKAVGLLPHRKWIKIVNRITKKKSILGSIDNKMVILAFLKELFYDFEIASREFSDILQEIENNNNFLKEIQKQISDTQKVELFNTLIELLPKKNISI